MIECVFEGNKAQYGGAGLLEGGWPTFVNCEFFANHSVGPGGAFRISAEFPYFGGCAFRANVAEAGGGVLDINRPSVDEFAAFIENCAFVDNANTVGTDFLNLGDSAIAIVQNSIFWQPVNGSGPKISVGAGATLIAERNCIQGLATTIYSDPTATVELRKNTGADPRFVDALGLDGIIGTEDDDLRLRAFSPCIDAGQMVFLPSLWQPSSLDLGGLLRFVDDPAMPDSGAGSPPVIDIGPYEYQADCNHNGVLDSVDIQSGTSSDCDSNGVADECQPDLDGDGVINACDDCQDDPTKTDPGICGCGVADVDADGNGVLDCLQIAS